MGLFSDVWSENAALFKRLMKTHSNPPILYIVGLKTKQGIYTHCNKIIAAFGSGFIVLSLSLVDFMVRRQVVSAATSAPLHVQFTQLHCPWRFEEKKTYVTLHNKIYI